MNTTNKQVLRVDEVAAYFGIAKRTVYNWRSAGLLRGVKIGNCLFFRREEVERIISDAETQQNEGGEA